MERRPAKVCQKCCYRLASLWFWWAATQAWWIFETSWEYFLFMFALGAGQIDPESTAGQAICDNSLGHHQNCLHNMRKLPYDHLVLAILTCNHTQLYTCRSTGCFTSCFLIGAMRWLSCRSAAKEVHLQIWPWPKKNSRPPSMICCHSGRWEEGFKLEAFPVPSLPTYGSASGFSRSNYWASSGTACVQAKILQTG